MYSWCDRCPIAAVLSGKGLVSKTISKTYILLHILGQLKLLLITILSSGQ